MQKKVFFGEKTENFPWGGRERIPDSRIPPVQIFLPRSVKKQAPVRVRKKPERRAARVIEKFIFPKTCKAERIGYISGEIPWFHPFFARDT